MTMRRRTRAFTAMATLVGAAGFAACAETTAPGAPEPLTELPRTLSAAELRVIEGSNAFAFDFLRALTGAREGENVFTSPLSASMAFGMAMNGAEGETWSQMRDVLGFDGLEEAQINAAYLDLITLLSGLDPAVTFEIANSVWADEGFPVEPDFVERVRTWFEAEARTIDLHAADAADVINDWVADATSGRIDDLIDDISPDLVLYLINAIYFNGDWRSRFDPARTATGPFTTLDGATVQVPLMTGGPGLRVASVPGATIVELPYGADAFSAVAVLPARGGADSLAVALTAGEWAEWMAALEAREPEGSDGITVLFPRFELEWESELNEAMVGLGMEDAFDPSAAEFERMGPGLFIGEAKQKTFLKVDEEGTEAAAATSVGMRVTSTPPTIAFDRPFLLAIRERLSGTILFLGLIGNPEG